MVHGFHWKLAPDRRKRDCCKSNLQQTNLLKQLRPVSAPQGGVFFARMLAPLKDQNLTFMCCCLWLDHRRNILLFGTATAPEDPMVRSYPQDTGRAQTATTYAKMCAELRVNNGFRRGLSSFMKTTWYMWMLPE